jgi:hypothetical protein
MLTVRVLEDSIRFDRMRMRRVMGSIRFTRFGFGKCSGRLLGILGGGGGEHWRDCLFFCLSAAFEVVLFLLLRCDTAACSEVGIGERPRFACFFSRSFGPSYPVPQNSFSLIIELVECCAAQNSFSSCS